MTDHGGTPDAVLTRAGLLRIALAPLLALILGAALGSSARGTAYLAAVLALLFGVLLVMERPRAVVRERLAHVSVDAALIALLVHGTGGGDSQFFALYFFAALGMAWIEPMGKVVAGGVAVVAGYLVAAAAFDPAALLSPGVMLRAGLLALFCAGVGFLGREVSGLERSNRSLSSELAVERSHAENVSRLSSELGPMLEMLDRERILTWVAEMAREFTGGSYAHVVLLDRNHHGTSMKGELDACPTWWHPAIQEMVLWSARNREVLRSRRPEVRGIENFLTIPMDLPGSEYGGAIVVGGGKFGTEEERILKALAEQASSALRHAGDAPGGRDLGTGLPNRASLHRVVRRELRHGEALAVIVLRLDGFWDYRRTLGLAVADALVRRIGERLLERHRVFRYRMDEFFILLRGGDLVRARQAALWSKEVVREIAGGSSLVPLVGYAVTGHEDTTPEGVLAAARQSLLGSEARIGGVEGLGVGRSRDIVSALFEAVSIRDDALREHLLDVSHLARRVGDKMGLSPEELEALTAGALLHDLGKIGLPDSILKKPSALSDREYEIVKRHTVVGARILEHVAELSQVALVVKHHHERFDGAGYPEGLRGADIPLLARIVFVVDAFDSMVGSRPYRERSSHKAALREIARNSGKQFDPRTVEALFEAVEDMEDRRASSAG